MVHSNMVIGNTNLVWFIVTIAVICQQIGIASPQTVPEKPPGVGARAGPSSTSIRLIIINVNGATHYRALYEHNSMMEDVIFPRENDLFTEHEIFNLSTYTDYTFCVYSVIRSGGEDQNSSTCTNSTPIWKTGTYDFNVISDDR
ncbi:unnamed protein product [Owenia fusiformis]|uniref:Uncharacterized protein n=1 Tax=Owenia fusiformis TaxID=6347 RepID=A0A8S4PYL1_OWEFU|nr:unnamed protein product [Owenia fusiformis]